MSLAPYPSQRWDRTLTLTRKSDSMSTDHPSSKRFSEANKLSNQSAKAVPGNGSLTRTVTGVVKRRKHVVLLGLDGSGKTTILMKLKFGCLVSTVPTIGFNHEKVWGGGFRWSAWDVGGGEKLRPLWVMYARATDGIVFVVDASSNNDLIEEARVELSRVIKASKLSSQTLNTSPPPVLVLANFQDKSYARGPEEVAIVLGLSEQWASGIMWAVAPVCGLTGDGLDGALHTLRTLIDGSKKERKKVDRQMQKKNPPRWRW